MAVLFCDSFDHYTTLTDKWTSMIPTGFTPVISAGNGRNATAGLRTTAGTPGGVKKTCPGGNKVTAWCGFAFRLGGGVALNGSHLITFGDNGTEQVAVRIRQDQRLEVTRGGVNINTGATTLQQGVFYYIEFKATIDPAAGAYRVRINGIDELNVAAVNTRNTANSFLTEMWLGGISGGGGTGFLNLADFDDFVMGDLAGANNPDLIGDVRVQAIVANGAGGNTAFTTLVGAATHWQATAEKPPDDDTSYVASATAGQIDTYALENLIPTTGTIKAIQTVLDARKDDGGVRTLQPELRIAAANFLVGAPHNIGNTYGQWLDVLELSPATAIAFTIAEVNGMEAGANLIA